MDVIGKFLQKFSELFYPQRVVAVPTAVTVGPALPVCEINEEILTLEQLAVIMPKLSLAKALSFHQFLLSALKEFEINTPARIAAFLAQIAHESIDLTVFEENLNYSAQALVKTWPTRFDITKASGYARKPEKIANHVYANRLGNGDEASGDGWRYRGRGPIQLTGKENYKNYGDELKIDLVKNPELLALPEHGFRSAGLFWKKKGLNELADKGEFKKITLRINGGYIGLAHREEIWKRAKEVLGVE